MKRKPGLICSNQCHETRMAAARNISGFGVIHVHWILTLIIELSFVLPGFPFPAWHLRARCLESEFLLRFCNIHAWGDLSSRYTHYLFSWLYLNQLRNIKKRIPKYLYLWYNWSCKLQLFSLCMKILLFWRQSAPCSQMALCHFQCRASVIQSRQCDSLRNEAKEGGLCSDFLIPLIFTCWMSFFSL